MAEGRNLQLKWKQCNGNGGIKKKIEEVEKKNASLESAVSAHVNTLLTNEVDKWKPVYA